jgi:uncharacterized protein YqeY
MAVLVDIKGKLRTDRTAFWKAGKTLEKDVLGLVLSGIETTEKSGKTPKAMGDMDTVMFLRAEVKKRRDTAKTYADAGIADRAARETAEADFLSTYLIDDLTEEAITELVKNAIAEVGPGANLGQVMKLVVPFTKGRADGAVLRRIVEENLA